MEERQRVELEHNEVNTIIYRHEYHFKIGNNEERERGEGSNSNTSSMERIQVRREREREGDNWREYISKREQEEGRDKVKEIKLYT